jgi:hypothetical protein
LLTACAFGLLLSSAFAEEKTQPVASNIGLST